MQRGSAAFQEPQTLYLMISGTGQAMKGFRNGKLLPIPSLLHLELYDLEYITGSFCASVYPFSFIQRGGEEYVKKNFSHSSYLQASMPLRMDMKPCLRQRKIWIRHFFSVKFLSNADNKCIEENTARVLENGGGDRNKVVIMYNSD